MAEPWLRGTQLNVDPAIAAVLFALQQVREDLAALQARIHADDLWREIPGIPPLGFQLSHIAGSLDRLTTYLGGGQLSNSQLAQLSAERSPGPTLEQLTDRVEVALQRTENTLRAVDPVTFPDPRYVGRRMLPTTVIGLAIHIAEHTQRHCGQAVTTSKLRKS